GVSATLDTWPNSGGTLNSIQALLTVDGGTNADGLSGLDLLRLDDTGDATDNTGELTSTRITGLGTSDGITYTTVENLGIALGSGNDTFTISSTHAGAFRPTSLATNNGNDTVIIRSVSGPLSVDTGLGGDTVRVSSTVSGTGGVLTGIDALVTLTGAGGAGDALFVDDTQTTGDVIGVVTDDTIHGLGMTLGGSAPRPDLVQVITVLNAFDGRFTLTFGALGVTAEIDFDASAAIVQRAIEAVLGLGTTVVTMALGRWVIAYTGALASDAGWAKPITALTASLVYPLSGDPAGAAVVTGFSAMTDGLLHYTGFESLTLGLGSGNDALTIDDTAPDATTTINLGAGKDRAFLEAIGGTTRVNGEAGDDWLVVNAVPDAPGVNPMDDQRLTLDGGLGSDYAIVGLWGVGESRIDVLDTGYDGGTNVLVVNAPSANDTFLLRRRLIALLSALNVGTGVFAEAEKVTYTDGINGMVLINGNDGDDTFALDDTATMVTINGGTGNDTFRIGQLYTSYVPDPEFGETDFFASTRGSLSNGISFPATINGGSGDDTFEVFRNRAALQLNGDTGDDTFIIRSFVAESEITAVNAGQGRDYIEYATNAPVAIDGGEGNDLIVVIGTEFDDTYVITAVGIYGAGRYITYVNVERLNLYGMEGDDIFYIVSTNDQVSTNVYGGLGSDRMEVAAQAPAVQSDDLLGHTGLIRHSVESTNPNSQWAGIPVDGIAAEILDDDESALVVETVGGGLVLNEATGALTGLIRLRATLVPTTDVEVTIAAPAIDPTSTSRKRFVELSLDGITWNTSVTVVLAAGSSATQTIHVRASFDNSTEGERLVVLQTMVTGRRSGTVATAGSTGITVSGSALGSTSLIGREVIITSGTGAGQTRLITANTSGALTIGIAWETTPDTTSAWMIRGIGEYSGLAVANNVVRVVDDESAGVVVLVPEGGLVVVEPSVGGGGSTAAYTVRLSRLPLASVTVQFTVQSTVGLQLGLNGAAAGVPLLLTFTTGNWATGQTVLVSAANDALVEGQHVVAINATLTSSDATTGTVQATTGRSDEFQVTGGGLTAGTLRGFTIRITSGAGAGQVRTIWNNTATVLVVEGDWDVLPSALDSYVITGYTPPASTGEVSGTVSSTSNGNTVLTLPGASLPLAPGALTGALIRVAGQFGAANYRTVASNTVDTITVTEPWTI
ncbi:MAG: hypothetical protein WAS07_00575, partial [Micropruina sp.]